MRLLLYEPDYSGHHLEFIRHLVVYFIANRTAVDHLICVTHPRLGERDPELEELALSTSEITLARLSEREARSRRESATRVSRSLREWRIVERYGAANAADHALLLHLNPFQFALGVPWFGRSAMGLSGILLNPFVYLDAPAGSAAGGLARTARRTRKYLLMLWMLRNRALTDIFLLNNREGARKLDRMYGRKGTFRELPDPVPPRDVEESLVREMGERYGLSDERMIFLLCGSLNRRKGVERVLQAARRLDADVASRMVLLMLGKIKSDIAASVARELSDTARARPELQIVTDDRFLPGEELNAAFDMADVVLAPYQKGMEGSSGILGHAAAAGKPVIGPDRGLIGSLIRRYDLGTCVETTSAAELAKALTSFVETGPGTGDRSGSRRYAEERTPARFAGRIFEVLS